MPRVMCCLALVAACAAAVGFGRVLAPAGAAPPQDKPSTAQPLPDGEPLLLLDEGPGQENAGQQGADNSRCYVCHLNFALEKLAAGHARAGVGCAKCHGECDEHIADESWASGGPGTPPDIMYPRERIDPACRECHPKHNVPARKVIAAALKRGLARRDPQTIVCTDCHGQHRLKPELRKATWDKRTGKPIPGNAASGDPNAKDR